MMNLLTTNDNLLQYLLRSKYNKNKCLCDSVVSSNLILKFVQISIYFLNYSESYILLTTYFLKNKYKYNNGLSVVSTFLFTYYILTTYYNFIN